MRTATLIENTLHLRAARWALFVASLCFAHTGLGTLVGRCDQPNIVIILADDMGYGDVQALNPDSVIPTPNLDALAASGMTFTDAHSPSAVCTPTRYGLLTGRYCWRSKLEKGVLGGYSPPLLEPGRPTIANMLKNAGYATGAVGKWHLGMELPMLDEATGADEIQKWAGDPGVNFAGTITNGPTHHGFDNYFGVTASLDMPPYVWVRDDTFSMLPTMQQDAVKFPHFVRAGPRSEDFVIADVLDQITQEAVDFIGEKAKSDKPYFLYMPLTGPHKPTQPHERFRGVTGLAEYGDFVHQVDWTIGQVRNAIEASGESESTLIFFTSDNGSYMHRYDEPNKKDHVDDDSIQGFRAEHHRANGALRGTKADIWEAGHRVPCFVSWPANIESGSKCDATVCHVDLFATIADITENKLTSEEAEDSVSWTGLLHGESESRGIPVIHHSVNGTFAIRDGKWKLVCSDGSGGRQQPKGTPFGKPFQLFDLEADLAEANDLAKAHPEIVERLTQRLNEIRDAGRSIER